MSNAAIICLCICAFIVGINLGFLAGGLWRENDKKGRNNG